jgi:2-keto-4-pentenoate hydratase
VILACPREHGSTFYPCRVDDRTAERAAALILEARLGGVALQPLPEDVRPRDEADGYRIQDSLRGKLTAAGRGQLAGYKIGCTTPIMQAYLNIPNPCSGGILAPTVHRGSAILRAADYLRAGVECEIAVELGRDLDGSGSLDRATLSRAVAGAMTAMEIVDDRFSDYPSMGTPTLIADEFFNAGCVLAEPVRNWRELDLTGVRGRMWINDELAGEGRGSDILGDPLNALAWIARNLADRGSRLHAGMFVMLGSVVTTRWVVAGDDVRIEVDGLGEARATFT